MISGGVAQLDLFAAPAPRWWLGEGEAAQAQRLGWERRVLADMAAGDGSVTYSFPGFMGAACERLVSKGLATKEDAGEATVPDFWPKTRKALREWAARGSSPMFRYALTEAGRAVLSEAAQ